MFQSTLNDWYDNCKNLFHATGIGQGRPNGADKKSCQNERRKQPTLAIFSAGKYLCALD